MSDSSKFRSEEWFQERFGNLLPEVDPNFDTSNCPDDEFLSSLVSGRKKPSLFDPRTSHVLDCPHCMRKTMLMREQAAKKKSLLVPRIWVPALVACLLVVAVVTWVARDRRSHLQPQQVAVVKQTIDLSAYGTYRGGGFRPQETIALPASVVTASIVLPPFSESGGYLVAVDRNREEPNHLVQATATTISQQKQQILTVILDLHTLAPGLYFLATTHRESGVTYYYPLEIVRVPRS